MDDIRLRPATDADLATCETLVRDAFWNIYRPGCFEHLIWHRALSGHSDLVAALVATDADVVVGCVLTARALVLGRAEPVPVLSVGPIAVRPDRQSGGIGTALMEAALADARERGERAAFLYGAPAYYHRFGFRDAATWRIATAEGDNFEDFMGRELRPGGLDGVTGRLLESPVFEVTPEDVDAFDAAFPPRDKATRPPSRD